MKCETNDTIILSLDTSSKHCSIAISFNNKIISEYNFMSDNKLSSVLIPALEFVMKAAEVELRDINVFGVGIGPGAFTGIRIGLSTLKGLIFGKEVSVVPVVTLKAMACKFQKVQSVLIPLIQAKRNEVYMAGYSSENGSLKEIIAPDLTHINKLKTRLHLLKDFCFVGNGAAIFNDFLKNTFQNCRILNRSSFLATEICQIALLEYRNRNIISNLNEIKPFYLRKPDAESPIKDRQNKDTKGSKQRS
jgi:tRNA threonylcarbamoyladenosine biosynthesis protein TsaB